jgi:hypothetical protein
LRAKVGQCFRNKIQLSAAEQLVEWPSVMLPTWLGALTF